MKHLDLTGLAHESEAAWSGVLDLVAVCADGWSLAGGQAVFVQTALRGRVPDRPSTDADLVIDLRADPGAARRLTEALREIGFEPTLRDGNGRMHRWIRGEAQVDVLQPRYLGERVEKRLNRQGLETIGAPGAQHLLSRTEMVEVQLGERSAAVRAPTALGIIVAKAAGFQEIIDDPYRVRHLADILTVGPLVRARELREETAYTKLEQQRVANAVGQSMSEKYTAELLTWFPNDLQSRIERTRNLHHDHAQRSQERRLLDKLSRGPGGVPLQQAAVARQQATRIESPGQGPRLSF